VLRPLRQDDVEPFAAAFKADDQLGVLLGFDQDPGEDYVRERLRDERRKLREGRSLAFAIAEPDTGDFRGEVLLHTFEWEHARAAIGIWVAPDARGHGMGACALRLISHYGFEELGLRRLEMTTFPDNEPLVRMAERVGFVSEGVLRSYTFERGKRRDLLMLSLLPGDLR
jgi:RimJ/RimL family protein N-acetyltransferase